MGQRRRGFDVEVVSERGKGPGRGKSRYGAYGAYGSWICNAVWQRTKMTLHCSIQCKYLRRYPQQKKKLKECESGWGADAHPRLGRVQEQVISRYRHIP